MSVREFNGTSDNLRCGIGAASGMTYGTLAILVKFNTVTGYRFFAALDNSGGTTLAAPVNLTNFSWIEQYNGAGSANFHAVVTGRWYLFVVRKGTGTVAPRVSQYDYTSTSWTHTAGDATLANWTSPGASGEMGFAESRSANFFGGRIAARAVWSDTLPWASDSGGDSAIAAAGLEDAAQNWLDETPSAFWLFNQASTGTAVEDVSAGGTGDQTAISGTTVVEGDDPPGFDFSLGAGDILDPYQWVPRPPAGPAPRLFRAGVRAPFQLMGDRTAEAAPTPVTLSDTAAAADALSSAAAVPFSDTAAAADALTITAALGLADTAAASDALALAATVALTETASADDALTVDVATAVSLSDTAAAADALTITTTLGLADTATASDTLTIAAEAVLADTASAAETLTAGVPISLAETASAADALTISVSLGLADTAAASDAASITTTLALADTGSASDSLSVLQAGQADPYQAGPRIAGMFISPAQASFQLAGSSEAVAGTEESVSLSDTATAADALAVSVAVALADAAAAVELLTAGVPISLADTATASDALTSTVAVPLTETASASDTLAISVALALADTATAAEALTAGVPITLSDTASASDVLTVQVVGSEISLSDTVTASDALTVTVALTLTDTATAAESINIPEAPQQAVVSRITTGHQMSRASTEHQMSRIVSSQEG